MSVVCFEAIKAILPSQATSADILHTPDVPVGPIGIGLADNRTTLYDPLWGYFLFGQEVANEYDDDETYRSVARFTIEGRFTAGAERALGNQNWIEEQIFNVLVAKYEALKARFESAALAAAPVSLNDWGQASDPRCIALPEPLRDKQGQVIYAIPDAIDIHPGQFTNEIAYTATLSEAVFPICKVVANGFMLDDATITIACPRPILHRIPINGCAGEVIQVENYEVAGYEVSGTQPYRPNDGYAMTRETEELVASLQDGTLQLGVVRRNGGGVVETAILFPDLDVDEGGGVDLQIHETAASVSIKARAKQ